VRRQEHPWRSEAPHKRLMSQNRTSGFTIRPQNGSDSITFKAADLVEELDPEYHGHSSAGWAYLDGPDSRGGQSKRMLMKQFKEWSLRQPTVEETWSESSQAETMRVLRRRMCEDRPSRKKGSTKMNIERVGWTVS
jgi:hypothetical protein